MKLSPYFTAFGNLAHRLTTAGAGGLVLFNRFFAPDIDVETLSVTPATDLFASGELRLRLQWIAMLKGHIDASLAIAGGVASPADGIKALLAGADAVQVVSAILRHGPSYFGTLREGLTQWMAEHDFIAAVDVCGRLRASHAIDVGREQRAHYIRTIHSTTGSHQDG